MVTKHDNLSGPTFVKHKHPELCKVPMSLQAACGERPLELCRLCHSITPLSILRKTTLVVTAAPCLSTQGESDRRPAAAAVHRTGW